MSESIFKTAVAEIVLRHGVAVTDDSVRLHNLLRDYCSSEKCRREINLTVMCARNGLLALLRETDARTPLAAHLNRVVCILHEEYGIEQSFAQNVVGIWSEWLMDASDPAEEKQEEEGNPSKAMEVDLGNGVALELVWCSPGSFTMGSPEDKKGQIKDKTQHHVTLTKGFWMGRTAVTQAQYQKVTGRNPSHFKGDDLPVEWVSWDNAVAFCNELTRRARTAGRLPQGYVYRLPTEAEWEFAAKGGSKSKGFTYSGGNDLDAVGWYGDNSGLKTHPVGQKVLNELGICDMSGNVWEWCQDWHAAYPASNEIDPKGPSSGSRRVIRGGGWCSDASRCRSAHRDRDGPSIAARILGFRVVLAVSGDKPTQPVTGEPEQGAGSLTPGKPWTTPDLGMVLMPVAAGSFQMGSEERDEKPGRTVQITRNYWMGKTAVTQAQYQKLPGENPSKIKGGDRPVDFVNWDDAVGFCVELTRRERTAGRLPNGYEYRLPTEAEWEYAARGGAKSKGYTYSGGNDLDAVGWYDGNSGGTTHPVGQKVPNELGLCDMSGNVWEWCQDWHAAYPASYEIDPKGPSSGSRRVYRGGSWHGGASYCRSSYRWLRQSFAGSDLGFRVVLAVSEDKTTQPVISESEQGAGSPKAKPTQSVICESVQVAGSPKAKPAQSVTGGPEPGAPSPMPGKPWTTPDLGMVLMPIEAGSFQMGSENGFEKEKPVRTVRITRDFWMGRTPVTQAQYRKVTGKAPSYFKGDDLPVEQVSWDDAVAFCDELTRREHTAGRLPQGYVYRLPTEAEWEYAAQGGSKGKGFTYSGGNDIDAVGWYGGNSGGTTHPVGQKEPNELGLYDMSGNVWEWCQDWHAAYPASNEIDPKGPSSGSYRVLRGGGWVLDASFCRSSCRNRGRPSDAFSNLGFRVVLAPVP